MDKKYIDLFQNFTDNFYERETPCNAESTVTLFEDESVKIVMTNSNCYISPDNFWYDQKEGEYVKILQGEGELEFFEGSRMRLKKADMLYIEPHKKHRISYTSGKPQCVWLCMFLKKN